MTYISWALYVEGNTDGEYFGSLIPRLIEDVVRTSNGPVAEVPEQPVEIYGPNARAFDFVASEVCRGRDAISLFFVHGDMGGANLAQNVASRTSQLCEMICERCEFCCLRCIPIKPRKETEAWCLVDLCAVRSAFGLSANYQFANIPDRATEIERLDDPKRVIKDIISTVGSGGRSATRRFPFARVAQHQNLARLRLLPSFLEFDRSLRKALGTFQHFGL